MKMTDLSAHVATVRNYLASNHMLVDEDWLSGCVEYLTDDSSSNFTESEIQDLAKGQWLLNDLKDICPGSLPRNLKEQRKTMLNGRFVLQINAAVDIGTPAYQQYLKLQKTNMENIDATTKFEDKISSHRMIKLYLTDGAQEVEAIEYKPMRNLSCDITPGCKVLIKGPVECRRGILLLTESTVELLGGEVQEIAVSNSLAGLLSAKLGLPMTQETDHNTAGNQPRNSNIPTPHTQMPSSRPVEETPILEPTLDHISRPIARITSIQVAHNMNDDDIDFDQLAAIEAQFSENTLGNKRTSEEYLLPNQKKPKMDTIVVNNPNDYPDDDDIFGDEDQDFIREMEDQFDAKLNESDPNVAIKNYPIPVSTEPFVFIKQINDMKVTDKAGRVFRVKGQIMKLLSKLSVGKDGWSLKCTIVDGTGNIDVDFTSEVLSKLVGFTPSQMTQMKKQMASQPELKEKAISALQKAKDSLQVLYCIIEITILDTPKITCLIPFEDSHVCMLRRRLKDSGL